MSKQLMVAVANGLVKVRNKTAGEISISISLGLNDYKRILIPAYGETELCPKHISTKYVDRIINLKSLVQAGALRIL